MLSTIDISGYITKANASFEANMLTITQKENAGEFPDALYEKCNMLSSCLDVLNSKHGLVNYQVERIIQKMVQAGNLNNFIGNPILYILKV